MIPKNRLDSLTDGVFAVAMTLLVIDIKLPETVHPRSAGELIDALVGLGRPLMAYVLSFIVLGLRWLGLARAAESAETASLSYARWTLVHLFLVTCVPFSTMVVGRHGNLAPAVCIYAGIMLLAAAVALRLDSPAKRANGVTDPSWRTELIVVIAVSAMVMVLSFFLHAYALLLYLLTIVPSAFRWSKR